MSHKGNEIIKSESINRRIQIPMPMFETFKTLLEIASPLLKKFIEKVGQGIFSSPRELSKEEVDKFSGLLTGRLIYLLRYMEQNYYPVPPKAFGMVLSSFIEVDSIRPPSRHEFKAEKGWEKASQYACYYLSMLGLVKTNYGVGSEVMISDLGKTLIKSDYFKSNFKNVFEQPLS